MKLFRLKGRSIEPIIGVDGKYHILYKTICNINGKFYIGIHSSKRIKDNYLGCGITSNIYNVDSVYTKRSLKRSALWRAVLKYGVKNFTKHIIGYFSTRNELIAAEIQLVNKDFINKEWNYNSCIGGSHPPINSGSKNGNFNNKWSDEQKQKASNYFKKNRDTKGKNNIRAVKCRVYDLVDMKFIDFECGNDLGRYIDVAFSSMRTWFYSNDILSSTIKRKRFICFRDGFYLSGKDLVKKIVEVVERSKLQKELKIKFINNVKSRKFKKGE